MKRHLAVALVLALAAPLVVLGCGKDNPVKVTEERWPLIYPDQSTPKNTILRMSAAFNSRDSVMTDSVYADDYEGTSIDLVDASPVTLTFVKSDEIGFVGALARSTSVSFVHMDLKPPGTWYQVHYVSDPPGWIAIQIPNFEMTIADGYYGDSRVHSPSAGESRTFEFTLRPTPDANSPTDTTWTIVRWVESRQSQ